MDANLFAFRPPTLEQPRGEELTGDSAYVYLTQCLALGVAQSGSLIVMEDPDGGTPIPRLFQDLEQYRRQMPSRVVSGNRDILSFIATVKAAIASRLDFRVYVQPPRNEASGRMRAADPLFHLYWCLHAAMQPACELAGSSPEEEEAPQAHFDPPTEIPYSPKQMLGAAAVHLARSRDYLIKYRHENETCFDKDIYEMAKMLERIEEREREL